MKGFKIYLLIIGFLAVVCLFLPYSVRYYVIPEGDNYAYLVYIPKDLVASKIMGHDFIPAIISLVTFGVSFLLLLINKSKASVVLALLASSAHLFFMFFIFVMLNLDFSLNFNEGLPDTIKEIGWGYFLNAFLVLVLLAISIVNLVSFIRSIPLKNNSSTIDNEF